MILKSHFVFHSTLVEKWHLLITAKSEHMFSDLQQDLHIDATEDGWVDRSVIDSAMKTSKNSVILSTENAPTEKKEIGNYALSIT